MQNVITIPSVVFLSDVPLCLGPSSANAETAVPVDMPPIVTATGTLDTVISRIGFET